MRALALVVASAVGLVLVAGCSTSTDGEARPVGGESSPTGSLQGSGSGSALPHSGAPKVEDPLDSATLTRVQQDPCSTLSTTQVRKLGLGPRGKAEDAQAGPFCRWSDVAAGSSASVYFPTKVIYEGLSQIYKTSKVEGRAEFFYAMAPVQGFPVVASDPADARDLGDCPVQVGLTDRQVMYVSVTLSREKRGQLEPCETAREVAGMALTTMRGNA